ncbi:G patch domain-containing protein, putative [Babesia bigemina]|uniref:G patch domain-containing protein, putative n=1 Tax=Babesia bigemina TaxID=5866 RepID=A0A061D2V8_BABBI|nr:G patch domain-containing protein, putative [Babesia bigemina]CDR94417.1 G patch domain-containing protein, putative [Babesia bigemina]|eukprot:XP_012766603.1 G patch domain-containing protein, putative [Babesia bigemina]
MSKAFRESVRNSISSVGSAVKSKFGAAILSKYGWKEGEGLGKNRDGIVDPVKLRAAKHNEGLGRKDSDQWHNWWDELYNEMASKSTKVTSVTSTVTDKGSNTENGESDYSHSGDDESAVDASSSELSSDGETSSDISSESSSSDESNRSDGAQLQHHSYNSDIYRKHKMIRVRQDVETVGGGDGGDAVANRRSDSDQEYAVEANEGGHSSDSSTSDSGVCSRTRSSGRRITPVDVLSGSDSEAPSAPKISSIGNGNAENVKRQPRHKRLIASHDNNAADSTAVAEKPSRHGRETDERKKSHRRKRQKQS